ncbi:MAG: hypothetical protein KGL34_07450 [Gammaproteobacteria bacterium]|nr:hypothetical protein [Gammaproteobacteria bacterium]
MTLPPEDELERYLRGADGLSSAYRRAARPSPPQASERRVRALAGLDRVRRGVRRDLAAYAACGLLALAALLSIGSGTRPASPPGESPQFMHAALRTGAPDRARDPSAWLGRIAELRAQGHTAAAAAEWRRFCAVHAGCRDELPGHLDLSR